MTAQTTAAQLLGTGLGAALGQILGSHMYTIMSGTEMGQHLRYLFWVLRFLLGEMLILPKYGSHS